MKILVKSKRLRISIRAITMICLFLFDVLWFNRNSTFAQTTGDFITQGDAFHDQFDTYGAFKSYKAASDLDSTNFDALWKMAGELIDMGNELPKSNDQMLKYLESETLARMAVQLNPNHAKGHIMLALAIEKTALDKTGPDRIKALNLARTAAEKALEISADEDMGHSLLGKWNREITNTSWLTKTYSKIFVVNIPPASYDKAIDHFTKAISINQASVSHYLELGKTYVLVEKWAEAGDAFQKAVDLPVRQKSDSKWQREAKHYIQLLQQGNHSELADSIEE